VKQNLPNSRFSLFVLLEASPHFLEFVKIYEVYFNLINLALFTFKELRILCDKTATSRYSTIEGIWFWLMFEEFDSVAHTRNHGN
jgi:hypothetical protein